MKKRLQLILLLFLISTSIFAADYYWVGGTGNWNDINHWRTTSGGTLVPSVIPGPTDNVYFDANSGFTNPSVTYFVYLNTTGNCNNITFSGCQSPPKFEQTGGEQTLNIYGSSVWQSGMKLTVTKIFYKNTNTPKTITSNGVKTVGWSLVYFEEETEIKLLDDFEIGSTLVHSAGTFNTNNKKVVLGREYNAIQGNKPRTLKLGSSEMHVGKDFTGWWTYFRADTQYLTLEAGTSHIHMYINNSSANSAFRTYHNQVYYNVTFENQGDFSSSFSGGTRTKFNRLEFKSDANIFGEAEIKELVLSPGKTYIFGSSRTHKITNSFKANAPSCDGWITIKSSDEIGSGIANLDLTGATTDLNRTIIRNMNAIAAPVVVADASVDNGGNTGFSFPASAGSTYYWVGGTGNWEDKNHWANASGGTPGSGCVPGPYDNVIFDSSSGFSPSNKKVEAGRTVYCHNISFNDTDDTKAPLFTGTLLNIYGSSKWQKSMTFNFNQTYYRNNIGSTATRTIESNGVKVNGTLFLEEEDTIELIDDIKAYSLRQHAGTFDTKGKTVNVYNWDAPNNSKVKTLKLGSSRVNVESYMSTYFITHLEATNSEIFLISASSGVKTGDGQAFNNITFSNPRSEYSSNYNYLYGGLDATYNKIEYKGDGKMLGRGIMQELIMAPGKKYVLHNHPASGDKQTVKRKLKIGSGDSCGEWTLLLRNQTNLPPAPIIIEPTTEVEVSRVRMEGIELTGGGTRTATESKDLGNNVGWNFTDYYKGNLYWVGGSGDWNDKNHWSTTSGGPGGACVPDPDCNVFFDDNSGFTSASKEVTISGEAYCKNITVSGTTMISPNIRNSYAQRINIYGSSVWRTGMRIEVTHVYRNTDTPKTIITNGAIVNSTAFIEELTTTDLLDSYQGSSIGLLAGTLNTNSNTIKLGSFYANQGTLSRTLNLGSSYITAAAVQFNSDKLTLDADEATIKLVGAWYQSPKLFTASGQRYKEVFSERNGSIVNTGGTEVYIDKAIFGTDFAPDECGNCDATINGKYNVKYLEFKRGGNIYGSNTFDKLVFSPSRKYVFEADKTQIIKDWVMGGNPCSIVYVSSHIAGRRANVEVTSPLKYNFVDIRDMEAVGNVLYFEEQSTVANQNNGNNIQFAPYNPGAFDGLGEDWLCHGIKASNPSSYIINTDRFYGNEKTTYKWWKIAGPEADVNTVISTSPTIDIRNFGEYGTYKVEVDYNNDSTPCVLESTVTLKEIVIPSAPDNILKDVVVGECSTEATWVEPVFPSCATVTKTHSPGDRFLVGVTTVTYSVTDGGGNIHTISFTVTVNRQAETNLSVSSSMLSGANQDMSGQEVSPDSDLWYEICYANTELEPIQTTTLTIEVPDNIIIEDSVSSFDFSGSEVTVSGTVYSPSYTYDTVSRIITVTLPKELTTANSPEHCFKINYGISSSVLSSLSSACDNYIALETQVVYEGGNVSCTQEKTGSTKSYVKARVDTKRYELYCGEDIVLSTGTDYTSYKWIKNSQETYYGSTYTATTPGTYELFKTAICDGQTIKTKETIIIEDARINPTNPLLLNSDSFGVCPSNGRKTAHYFMCNDEPYRIVNTGYINTTQITWQKMKSNCADISLNCPNAQNNCWTDIDNNVSSKQISDAGQYRLIVKKDDCEHIFYFNVYKQGISGQVTSLDKTDYNAGNIKVVMNSSNLTYTYLLTQNGSVVQGPITTNDASYTFNNLEAGTYDIEVSSTIGCVFTATKEVKKVTKLQFHAMAGNWLGCNKLQFIFDAAGGKAPYRFAIWSINGISPYNDYNSVPDTAFLDSSSSFPHTSEVFEVTQSGKYIFILKDSQGAGIEAYATSNEVIVNLNSDYDFTLTTTDIQCSSASNTGSVNTEFVTNNGNRNTTFNLYEQGNPNPIDSNSSGDFTGLSEGKYRMELLVTIGKETCKFDKLFEIKSADVLRGFAGIVEDKSCDTNSPKRHKVRISNVEGGKAPYEYSFNSASSGYGTSNEGYIDSSQSVFVKDTNGCILELPVQVQNPNIPTVTPTVSYACDGRGVIHIETDPSSSVYSYTYWINGVQKALSASNTIEGVATGTYELVVKYSDPSFNESINLLYKDDFGAGKATALYTASIATTLCFESQSNAIVEDCANDTNTKIDSNQYSISESIVSLEGGWTQPTSTTGRGRYLTAHTTTDKTLLYKKQLNGFETNTTVKVSLEAFAVKDNGAKISVKLSNGSWSQVKNSAVISGSNWKTLDFEFSNASQNSYTLEIALLTNNKEQVIAIDNVKVSQNTKLCEEHQVKKSVTIEPGKKFVSKLISANDPSCYDSNDWKATLGVEGFDSIAGYQYAIDTGVSSSSLVWSSAQNSSVITISDTTVTATQFLIRLRRANDINCQLEKSIKVTRPIAAIVTATQIDFIRCTTSSTASVRVSSINNEGGTKPYVGYRWISATATGTWQSNSQIANLYPGTYRFQIQDHKGCIYTSVPYTIEDSKAVTFNTTIDCTSDESKALVTVNVTDGNGDYMYKIVSGHHTKTYDQYNGFTPLSGVNPVFSEELLSGDYTIIVRDQAGCGTLEEITIVEPLQLKTSVKAKGGCQNEITIEVLGGTVSTTTPTISWSHNPSGTYTTTNVVRSGSSLRTYTLAVPQDGATYYFKYTDDKGCEPIAQASTEVFSTPSVTIDSTTSATCYESSDGSFKYSITGGIASYSLSVYEDDGSGQKSGTVIITDNAGLPAGKYVAVVTDKNGCESVPAPFEIQRPVAWVYTVVTEDLKCVSGTTTLGSISVRVSAGGNGTTNTITVYDEYGSQQSVTTALSRGSWVHFKDLDFGTYVVSIEDKKGCHTSTLAIIATSPDVLITTSANPGCDTGGMRVTAKANNGTIGNGDFYFSLYPTQAPFNPSTPMANGWYSGVVTGTGTATTSYYDFTGLTPGVTYYFVVHDKETKCEYAQKATEMIAAQSTLSATITPSNVSCKGGNNGSLKITIDGSTLSSTTDKVKYELYNERTHTVVSGTQSEVTVTSPMSTVSITGIAPGKYYVKFTEMNGTTTGCTRAIGNYIIKEPTQALTEPIVSTKDDTCQPKVGRIYANAQGGWGGYKFAYIPVATATATVPTPNASDWTSDKIAKVDNGYYYVFVKDANSCTKQTASPVEVKLAPKPDINNISVEGLCEPLGKQSIEVDMNTIGVQPLAIYINGVRPSTSDVQIDTSSKKITIKGLYPGNSQSLRIVDKNGCEDSKVFSIPTKARFIAETTKNLSCISNAEITIGTVNGGVPPYDYQIEYRDTNSTTTTSVVVQSRTAYTAPSIIWNGADKAGTYIVTLFDSNCSVSKEVQVLPAIYPTTRVTGAVNENCNSYGSKGSGMITVAAQDNGTGAFNFKIKNIIGLTSAEESLITKTPYTHNGYTAVFNELKGSPTGVEYFIEVQGGNGCIKDISYKLFAPAPISIAPTAVSTTQYACSTRNSTQYASVSIDKSGITGGSGNYTRFVFERTLGGSTEVVQDGGLTYFKESDLKGGNYQITVYDSKGCIATTAMTTIQPFVALKKLEVTQDQKIDCTVGENIKATITIDNPAGMTVPQFTYELIDISNDSSVQSVTTNALDYTFTNIGVGNYKVEVTHLTAGCQLVKSYDVIEPNTFEVIPSNSIDVNCKGEAQGKITLTFRDLYLNDGDQSTNGFSYTITEVGSPTHTFTGTIPSGTTTIVSGLTAGSYEVVATSLNPNACSTDAKTFHIDEPATKASLDTFEMAFPPTCSNDRGEIKVALSGGTPPYTLKLYKDGGTTPIKTASNVYGEHIFKQLSGGANPTQTADYTIEFEDKYGCVVTQSTTVITLTHPEFITATATAFDVSCESTNDGVVEVTQAQGGSESPTYFYALENITTSEVTYPEKGKTRFEDLAIGKYRVRVIDNWGCDGYTQPVEVKAPAPVTLQISSTTDLICFGENNGEITVNATGGTGIYTFTLTEAGTGIEKETKTGIVSGTNVTFSNLSPNVFYIVNATDDKGCVAKNPKTFRIPEAPNLESLVDQVYDCVSNTFESELEVTFKNTPNDYTYISYVLNDTDPTLSQPFDRTLGNKAYIKTFDSTLPNQYLTIFVKAYATSTTYCDSGQISFTVENLRQLEFKNIDATTKINTIIVEGQYGVQPYAFYFNDREYGTGVTKEYLVKRNDPGYTNAQGHDIKQIKVRIEDQAGSGCYVEQMVEIRFYDIEIPEYFTPDNDGNNDEWYVRNTRSYPNIRTHIYDRYGRLIKILKEGEKWDGKYNGKELPSGDYWYIIELNEIDEDRTFKGHFTLYR